MGTKYKWDYETILEIERRLTEHYPHSPTVCKTIEKVVNEMLDETEERD